MQRPKILVTPSLTANKSGIVNAAYFDAVWESGGLPVFARNASDEKTLLEYADFFDGFLFSGGPDVDPKYYGEEIKFDSVSPDPARDEFEIPLAKIVFETKKPVLGICRGMQLMNVVLGGTLFQHIDGHRQREKSAKSQRVVLKEGTPLFEIADGKKELFVNSFHHQAVDALSPSLVCMCKSDDGICEAVYGKTERFLLGVQWHPERLFSNDETAKKIFAAFVRNCDRRQEKRDGTRKH